VRQQLEAYAKARTDVRIMDGRFMTIQQAMGTPKGREAGAKYLAAFVEDMKASGFVADGPGPDRGGGAPRSECHHDHVTDPKARRARHLVDDEIGALVGMRRNRDVQEVD
jgi:hypothetical protein